ncbi:MAG TPA: hypothetical protein VKV37_04220 [Ktedonobacteraceae bacterium]|nr:hypothetical protein [Ktedonobacteraceae bacterium]
MSMQQSPSSQGSDKGIELFVLVICLLVAWPAVLLGLIARGLIKRHTIAPFPYWIGAGALGALGTIVLLTRLNPSPFVPIVEQDLVALLLHLSMATFLHFVYGVLPLWERSVLVFPWCILLAELFSKRSLQSDLLTQERRRRAWQARQSRRAARKAAKAPDQINGQAVLGVLIDDPNQ